MKKFTSFLVLIAITISGFAQTVLFEENFDDAQAASRWTVADVGGTNVYDMAVDYVTAGLPAAPNGGGLGFQMSVNTADPGVSGSQILAFPTGESFTGEYTMRFDAWFDFSGATSGTTQFATFGVKATDTNAPNTTGVSFSFTDDNGSGHDVWIYDNGVGVDMNANPDDSVFYAPYSQNINGTPYYENSFDGDDASGEWLDILVQVTTDSVFFSLNGNRWCQYPSGSAHPDGNVYVGLMDVFSSVADGPLYLVVDNFKVYQGVVSVADIKNENISVYPNPANDILNIVSSVPATFELINIAGKTIKTGTVNGTTTVNVSNLSKGMYFARVTTQSGQVNISKVLIK